MTDRELMQQALEMIEDARNGSQRKPSEPVITALRERLARPERVQLTVRDFVITVGGIEDAVGTPAYWAEWPNKEQP